PVLFISRVNAERKFKLLGRTLRKSDELPEFVSLHAIALSTVFDRSVGAAPAGYRREAAIGAGRADGPVVENHWRTRMPPGEAAGRNVAPGAADVLTDREVIIMAGEPRAVLPELRVPRIVVVIDADTRGLLEWFPGEV